jgi:hypothetical protein
MNYTKPNDPDHIDNPTDWLYSSLVFSQALGILLQEGEGVVVELKGDATGEDMPKKVIVWHDGTMVSAYEDEDDLPHGQMVWVHKGATPDDIKKFNDYDGGIV